MRTEMFRAKKHSVKIPRFAWLNRSWIEPIIDIALDLRKADLGDVAPRWDNDGTKTVPQFAALGLGQVGQFIIDCINGFKPIIRPSLLSKIMHP